MSIPEKSDNLDRVLLNQETLLPSSGFAASVMEAVQNEASEPQPIPFPWKRALPGMAAIILAIVIVCRLAASAVQGISHSSAALAVWSARLLSSANSAGLLRAEIAPALCAIAASFVCAVLCVKWAGGWSTR